jgi:hypothetical protein
MTTCHSCDESCESFLCSACSASWARSIAARHGSGESVLLISLMLEMARDNVRDIGVAMTHGYYWVAD